MRFSEFVCREAVKTGLPATDRDGVIAGLVDALVEAGVVNSRSESAAFLIREGIKGNAPLFDRISVKVEEIRRAKQELKDLLEEPANEASE